MNRFFQYVIAIAMVASLAGCENYARYTIDPKPQMKTDNSLLGIWKGFGDTSETIFMIVQDYNDVFHDITGLTASTEKYDIGVVHDMDYSNYNYFVTYVSAKIDGINRPIQQYTVFTSRVGNATFLNVDFNYEDCTEGSNNFNRKKETEGYCFAKLSVNEDHNIVTISEVADSTLKFLVSSQEVRNRIARNANIPSFYGEPAHFYRVSNYHQSLATAIKIAK